MGRSTEFYMRYSKYIKLNIVCFLSGLKVDYIFSLTFKELRTREEFLGIHLMEDPED